MKMIATCLSVLVLSWLPGCAVVDVYNVRGMEGNVVDKATGKPLEGVMVIEAWEIYKPGLHGTSGGYLPLRETRTDSNGNYRFSARGTQHIDGGYLDEASPWLIYFKPGYGFTSVMNEFHPDRRFEFNRKSDWDGKIVQLTRFRDTPEEQAKNLNRLDHVLYKFTSRGGWCIWTGIPNTLHSMRDENIRLHKMGAKNEISILAPWMMEELKKCPKFEKFYEEFSGATK